VLINKLRENFPETEKIIMKGRSNMPKCWICGTKRSPKFYVYFGGYTVCSKCKVDFYDVTPEEKMEGEKDD
jgi:hypothetical protein